MGYGEVAPGLLVPGKIDKMGYKGVDTTELVFDGFRISGEQILGGKRGGGFAQMMDGVEVGRVNVAARCVRDRRTVWSRGASLLPVPGCTPGTYSANAPPSNGVPTRREITLVPNRDRRPAPPLSLIHI